MKDWFSFSDMDKLPYFPFNREAVTIERAWGNEDGKINQSGWRKEDWLVRSALVSIDQLQIAARQLITPHSLIFRPHWDGDEFELGNNTNYNGVDLFPIVESFEHPITGRANVSLSREFIIYHALIWDFKTEYTHPTDNLLVATAGMEPNPPFRDSEVVQIHRDYLRDFLAARKMGLLISIIADRFANAIVETELEIQNDQEIRVGENCRISTYIQTPETTRSGYYRGRSILNRTICIEPYEKPRFARSPWLHGGRNLYSDSDYPEFIINHLGEKSVLPRETILSTYINQGIGDHGYLYFRPEVLRKYLNERGYQLHFHMRNWGQATAPGSRRPIDLGINSRELITAFGPDLSDLLPDEQAYWASFSSLPSGEICEELFQTRMQLQPPVSPGIVDLIHRTLDNLDSSFRTRFNVDLVRRVPVLDDIKIMGRLSVGPYTNDWDYAYNLIKTLYSLVVESLETVALRKALEMQGITPDKKLRQIKLLEELLASIGLAEEAAKRMTQSLAGLNELRVLDAHHAGQDPVLSFKLLGASDFPKTPRVGWNICVDAVILSLENISLCINN
ncbi:MAG: hypothetical protein EPO32_08635 [Anaerolineae bacterium]|nr:MAG: hypothetical protein EPO32_08635 [Anaerolineae bacterium]